MSDQHSQPTGPTPQTSKASTEDPTSDAARRGRHRSDTAPSRGWLDGRSGLVIPLILAAFSTYLAVGNLTMAQPAGVDFPGPTFYPWLLSIAGYVVAALLVLEYFRHAEPPEETSGRSYATFSDWPAVAWCVGGFAAFAALLPFLGWILAGALLFWCVARGIGSRRPLFDLSLALVVSSLVYLAFAVGLGLNLPSGVLGGGF